MTLKLKFRFRFSFVCYNKYIETVDKIENRKIVVQKTRWRPIYEVIYEAYIKESNILPDDFIRECKIDSNQPRFISSDVKNNMKLMSMEQSLYAQFVKLRRKDLLFVAADKNKSEAKFKFQGQSARSQLWFDLDLNWVEINFSTREPDFYKKLFQSHEDTQENNTFKKFKCQLEM